MSKLLLGLVVFFSATAFADATTHAASLAKLARARIEAGEKRSARLELAYESGLATLSEYLESRQLCFAAMRDSPIRGAERVKGLRQPGRAAQCRLPPRRSRLLAGRVQDSLNRRAHSRHALGGQQPRPLELSGQHAVTVCEAALVVR